MVKNVGNNPIDHITISVCLVDCVEYDDYDLISYSLDNPEFNIRLFSEKSETSIYSFPENLLNDKFFISVDAYAYTVPPEIREFEFRQWLEAEQMEPEHDNVEPYTPPEEVYPQEKCVICLESAPNILYLDCMHIAVCGVCDEKKRTAALRLKCDVCRALIARRKRINKK